MKDRLPTWVYEFAHKVASVPFVKALLKPVYYPIVSFFTRRRNAHFRQNATEVLYQFDSCMNEYGYHYTLIFGSLLGAIREKGFISHDCDIDTALYIEERNQQLYDALSKYGFSLIRRFSIKDGSLGCEETFTYKNTGVTVDVFYICPAIVHYPYVCCWNYGEGCASYRETMKKYGGITPRRIELPFNHKTNRVQFETIFVNIPENAHQISEFCYGANYMTPDPNYIIPTDHRVVWKEVKARYEEFS